MKYNYIDIYNRIKLLPEYIDDSDDVLIDLINKTIGISPSILNIITNISDYAFVECTNLALIEIPEGITSIGRRAFYGCTNLTNITFRGTPTSIGADAFSDCSNLTTINVPWAEGAVAYAPWGATNATINYNYSPT